MDTAGIFHTAESGYTDLWEVTWERIDIFLPNLKQELFRGQIFQKFFFEKKLEKKRKFSKIFFWKIFLTVFKIQIKKHNNPNTWCPRQWPNWHRPSGWQRSQ